MTGKTFSLGDERLDDPEASAGSRNIFSGIYNAFGTGTGVNSGLINGLDNYQLPTLRTWTLSFSTRF